MHRKLSDLDVGSNVELTLYSTMVLPAVLYGCEVFETCLLGDRTPADSAVLPCVHRSFIKFTLKMRHKMKA
jgi:hypothetical protein